MGWSSSKTQSPLFREPGKGFTIQADKERASVVKKWKEGEREGETETRPLSLGEEETERHSSYTSSFRNVFLRDSRFPTAWVGPVPQELDKLFTPGRERERV